jgi:hypothetical protein
LSSSKTFRVGGSCSCRIEFCWSQPDRYFSWRCFIIFRRGRSQEVASDCATLDRTQRCSCAFCTSCVDFRRRTRILDDTANACPRNVDGHAVESHTPLDSRTIFLTSGYSTHLQSGRSNSLQMIMVFRSTFPPSEQATRHCIC